MKIVWTTESIFDLDAIYNFYLSDNPSFAENLYDKIVSSAELLIPFPLMGTKEPLLNDKPQSPRFLLVFRMFKIIYYLQNDIIYITNIWDCRQDPEKLIKGTE